MSFENDNKHEAGKHRNISIHFFAHLAMNNTCIIETMYLLIALLIKALSIKHPEKHLKFDLAQTWELATFLTCIFIVGVQHVNHWVNTKWSVFLSVWNCTCSRPFHLRLALNFGLAGFGALLSSLAVATGPHHDKHAQDDEDERECHGQSKLDIWSNVGSSGERDGKCSHTLGSGRYMNECLVMCK